MTPEILPILTEAWQALGLPGDALGRLEISGDARLPSCFPVTPLAVASIGAACLAVSELTGEAPRQAGVADRILWAGWQHDPAPWFHVADMVVFPSRDAETLGNVILEAWAYGKPLVASAFRGAREITRLGEDAWDVPCDDGAALAAGIEHVIRNPGLQRQMVANGLARIERDFSEAAVIAQYRALYAHLLDNR